MNSCIDRRSYLAALALLAAVLAGPLAAQAIASRPDLGIRWAESRAAGPLEIVGLVVDVNTGLALEQALVFLSRQSVDHTGTKTDKDGRFALRAPAPGEYQLRFDLIGYRRYSAVLQVGTEAGVAVQIGTEQPPSPDQCEVICGYPPGCESGVRVEVRALDTGLAPKGPVSLAVRAGELRATVSGLAPANDPLYREVLPEDQAELASRADLMPVWLFTGGDLGTYGPFDVTVSARSYSDWTASGVWLTDEGCAKVSPLLRVWLLPGR